jgi:eukaryotic-like serine/threonine-protein kinase
MKATDILVLPSDVLVSPVEALGAEVRDRLDYVRGDCVVSRPRVRGRSLVVDSASAAFLEQFRSPKTVIEAVVSHAPSAGIPPQDLLDDVIPLITRMYRLRLLAVQGSSDAQAIEPTLPPGTCVAGCRLISCVHIFNDVEVYKVANDSGTEFALKLLRPHAPKKASAMLEREAAVLDLLRGRHAPILTSSGDFQDRGYLLTEWCAGRSVADAARELHTGGDHIRFLELSTLCLRILHVYAQLHKQEILHGDVHPSNVLVTNDDSIVLLDFGLSCSIGNRHELPSIGRAGIAEYMEPEYCCALERRQPLPPTTATGEQYALAALCYFLLSGQHYLNFSLEREQWRTQILRDHPRPFSECGVPAWPDVERVLAKALSKEPSERFAMVSEFANELALASKRHASKVERHSVSRDLLEGVLQRYGQSGPLVDFQQVDPPKCSVNYGASGIAYLFYRAACLRDDPSLLATADVWSSWSRENSTHPGAFYSSDVGINEDTVGKVSLYHSRTGVHCIQALISQAMGDMYSLDKSVQAFVASCTDMSDAMDLTIGNAGLLLGAATLLEALPDHASSSHAALRKLGDGIRKQLLAGLADEAIGASKSVPWLGIAHGWAGILYTLLRWRVATNQDIPKLEERLHELADLGTWKGSTVAWPLRMGRSAYDQSPRTGWCHGSAGYVHLWTLANRSFATHRFLQLAEGAAHHIWHSLDGTSVNGSLCCGYAGQGYAFTSLYRISRDPVWLRRARVVSHRAALAAPRTERRASLYKGDVGIALLLEELSQPELSATPVFEPEGWSSQT